MSNILKTKEKNEKNKNKPIEHNISIGDMTYCGIINLIDLAVGKELE